MKITYHFQLIPKPMNVKVKNPCHKVVNVDSGCLLCPKFLYVLFWFTNPARTQLDMTKIVFFTLIIHKYSGKLPHRQYKLPWIRIEHKLVRKLRE